MTHTVGLEIEMSDVRLVEAVDYVYGYCGKDPADWEDRWGGYNKPKLDYSNWNVMADGHIYNSDGSRCMFNYRDAVTGELVATGSAKKASGRKLWKGAELISPAMNSVRGRADELEGILNGLYDLGARGLVGTYIHVHIDISQIPFEQMRDLTPEWMKIQKVLNRLRWPHGGRAKDIPMYDQELVDDLVATTTPKEFLTRYHRLKRGGTSYGSRFSVRRIIDPTPSMDPNKSYNTMEFRLSRTIMDADYIVNLSEFAMWILETAKKTGSVPLDEVEEQVRGFEKWF